MKKGTIVLVSVILGFIALQFIRPNYKEFELDRKPLVLQSVPKAINDILENSCFNCHSSSPDLAWYDKITPINFVVNSHIKKGSALLNFSKWDSLSDAKRKGILYYSLNKIMAGEMPLPSYSMVHPSARISEEQMAIIKNYLSGITYRPPLERSSIGQRKILDTKIYDQDKKTKTPSKDYSWVEKSPNGIAYIPDYRNWKVISTTDRFDNGTIRIIFANNQAVQAIKDKQTNPWPDGSILAKVLWKQKQSKEGLITTGKFIHVEYMIKDAVTYANTQGWGWARWKGEELKPFGESADFVQQCIRCHSPVKDNDNVFTIPLNLAQLQKPIK